jgi:hypothetical protein
LGLQTVLLGLILIKSLYGRLPLRNQTVWTFKKLYKIIVQKRLLGKEPGTTQQSRLECIYNPITAMGFSAMFTFQLDNIKR